MNLMPYSVLLVEQGGVGGVADYTGELAGALARAGWAVTVATARDHRYPPQRGVRVAGLFLYLRGAGRLGRLLRRARMSKLVNGLAHLLATIPLIRMARGVDVVHVQGGEWPPLTFLQVLSIRAAGRPLVWTPHNTFDRGSRDYRHTRAATALCADRVVLHADYDREALPTRASARATVIPHGEYGGLGGARSLPAPEEDSALPDPGVGGDLVILLFGQLRPDKGIRDLLEAAIEVDGIRIWLVGEENGGLADAADLLAHPRLRDRLGIREGFVPASALRAVFAEADVVALPYRQASASGVLMLAYGYSRPVVVYPAGGLPEYVIPGETGWLCARSDPPALAAALTEIRQAGRSACRQRGAAARRLADERYSWSAIGRETIRLYLQLLHQPHPVSDER